LDAVKMCDKYFDQDQRRRLARRHTELGAEAIEQAERDSAALLDSVRAEMRAGTDPADPWLDELRARAANLVDAFTGGDPALSTSLNRMWSAEDPQVVSRGATDRELWDYYTRMREAGG
jgi:MerR family transcriptional regulator, thiopeptide resistance regulator